MIQKLPLTPSNKIKLLNNYQLYLLVQNELLDEETLDTIRREFDLRNISTLEHKQLKRQYQETFAKSNKELDVHAWNPFYTAFAWKRHFKHIALLKTLKRKKEAQVYQMQFYAGLAAYMLLGVLFILLFSK